MNHLVPTIDQVADEKMSNIRTVRVFTKERHEVENYTTMLQKVLKLGYKQALASAVFWGSVRML